MIGKTGGFRRGEKGQGLKREKRAVFERRNRQGLRSFFEKKKRDQKKKPPKSAGGHTYEEGIAGSLFQRGEPCEEGKETFIWEEGLGLGLSRKSGVFIPRALRGKGDKRP